MLRCFDIAGRAGTTIVLLVSCAGCALQSYHAAPLDAAASAQRFEARTLDSAQLKEYLLAHGHSGQAWPIERWGLTELTLLAFYDHPDLEVAHAQAKAARAAGAAAAQRPPLAITPRVEHHSLRSPDQPRPWSLGFEVQFPLSAASTGAAIRDHYDALARAADLRIGAAAWEVRARVRSRMLDVYGNALETELLENEVREREAMRTLLEQRLQAAAISSVEVNSARLALADAQSRLQLMRSAVARDLAGLAEALSLPFALVRSMPFDYTELRQSAPALQDMEMQRAALLNRLDIRGKLLEYAAAEADVRLKIARQYPTIEITPGFLWDQGDSVWSLAATLVPAVVGNRPAIATAQARREVEASQFRALQDRAIAQAQGAEATYASLAQALAQAEQLNALHVNRVQQVERRFEAGSADRVELTAARLEMLSAQRAAFALRIEALRAPGALEDALQIPLTGGPLPQLAERALEHATGLAQQ